MMSSFAHDPSAVLDYAIDWTAWLAEGETIYASTWTIPTGITQTTPAPSIAAGVTTVWISGGTVGTIYTVTNHITTSQGRQDDRSFELSVSNR
jgi:hypothetical protein